MRYSCNVSALDLKERFEADYPMVGFNISIVVEANNLDDAYSRVYRMLRDKEFRHAIAGSVSMAK